MLNYHNPTQIKKYMKGISNVMVLLLGLPTRVLKTEYHYDNDQCEKVANLILEKYGLIEEDYATLDDLFEILHDEANIEIADIVKKHMNISTYEDTAFMLVLSVPVLTMYDKCNFTPEQCDEFATKIVHDYTIYKKGYLTTYDLIQLVKKTTGLKLVKLR